MGSDMVSGLIEVIKLLKKKALLEKTDSGRSHLNFGMIPGQVSHNSQHDTSNQKVFFPSVR